MATDAGAVQWRVAGIVSRINTDVASTAAPPNDILHRRHIHTLAVLSEPQGAPNSYALFFRLVK